MNKNEQISQTISFDIGRGYVKAFTKVNGENRQAIFRSAYALGRANLDFSKYDDPILIEYNNAKYFIGDLAINENRNYIANQSDDKDTRTVDILIAAAISKLAVSTKINAVIGVPYRKYLTNEEVKIINKYKNKAYEVKDLITGSITKTTIENVMIFREADAALISIIENFAPNGKPFGIASVGYRTLELAYFDENLRFNDYHSDSVEFGTATILKDLNDQLAGDGIIKSSEDLDTVFYRENNKYLYEFGLEKLNQILTRWHNHSEMNIFIAGGTAENFDLSGTSYNKVENSQLATAIGLYLVGEKSFN